MEIQINCQNMSDIPPRCKPEYTEYLKGIFKYFCDILKLASVQYKTRKSKAKYRIMFELSNPDAFLIEVLNYVWKGIEGEITEFIDTHTNFVPKIGSATILVMGKYSIKPKITVEYRYSTTLI